MFGSIYTDFGIADFSWCLKDLLKLNNIAALMLIPCSKEQTGEGFQTLHVEHVHVEHVAPRLSPTENWDTPSLDMNAQN